MQKGKIILQSWRQVGDQRHRTHGDHQQKEQVLSPRPQEHFEAIVFEALASTPTALRWHCATFRADNSATWACSLLFGPFSLDAQLCPHRGSDVSVPHRLLLYRNRCSHCIQPRPVCVPEGVRTDVPVPFLFSRWFTEV